ncbi:MAG TPA: hypothetical protein VFS20_15470 [Longimicrobium sp.]|nr:hypothetical protein [Longimicrobium sp.]
MNGSEPENPARQGGRIDELLRGQRAEGFEPGFAWRVMHRLRAEQADPREALAAAVQRWFVRLGPVAALAVILFVALNLRAADRRQTVLEAVLGVPAVTLEQAYGMFAVPATPTTDGEG